MGFEIGDAKFLRRIAEALEEQNDLQEKQNDLLRNILESLNDIEEDIRGSEIWD